MKVVLKHIWESDLEQAEDLRHSPAGKSYTKRGETIERVFADAKEKHEVCDIPITEA